MCDCVTIYGIGFSTILLYVYLYIYLLAVHNVMFVCLTDSNATCLFTIQHHVCPAHVFCRTAGCTVYTHLELDNHNGSLFHLCQFAGTVT